MPKHLNLVEKICRQTQLPTDDVHVILKHAFREIRLACGVEDPKQLVILGHANSVKAFLQHRQTRPAHSPMPLQTNIKADSPLDQ